jgi:hypothetical protein
MGYGLSIGEATIEWNTDCVRIGCATERRDNAPAFGEPTDYSNQRWPSYTSWSNAMSALGLMDVMFDERNGGCSDFEFKWNDKWLIPLLATHPGATPITKEHVAYVEEKLAAYSEESYDGEWLLYWLRWAVENCENPVFVNR